METVPDRQLTAEEFAECRHELPDGGRWVELDAGRVVQFDPPDPVHGNVVLHLSKALAEHVSRLAKRPGNLCFELGLLVGRNPDTIHFPPVSFFAGSGLFDESDKIYTDRVPQIVVEIASTNSRRRGLSDRVAAYLRFGVEFVWIVDTVDRNVHVVRPGAETITYGGDETLPGGPVFPGFEIRVEELFAAPSWWK